MSSDSLIINGHRVWYEKFGDGEHPILMIPGAIGQRNLKIMKILNVYLYLGTGRSDFSAQLEGKDALDLSKYTLIAVELPGWGRSRPPEREYGSDIYKNDVLCCYQIMEVCSHFIIL